MRVFRDFPQSARKKQGAFDLVTSSARALVSAAPLTWLTSSPCSLRGVAREGRQRGNEEPVSLSPPPQRLIHQSCSAPCQLKRQRVETLIHNETQLLAAAGGFPAKAVMKQTSRWINVTLTSPFWNIFRFTSWFCNHDELLMTFSSAASIENDVK